MSGDVTGSEGKRYANSGEMSSWLCPIPPSFYHSFSLAQLAYADVVRLLGEGPALPPAVVERVEIHLKEG
jgi:hypothetical protein